VVTLKLEQASQCSNRERYGNADNVRHGVGGKAFSAANTCSTGVGQDMDQ
jgi:hypothetical protein